MKREGKSVGYLQQQETYLVDNDQLEKIQKRIVKQEEQAQEDLSKDEILGGEEPDDEGLGAGVEDEFYEEDDD